MAQQQRTTSPAASAGLKLLANFIEHLRAEKARLSEQIGSYPGPIPACDAQFNHLLEKRSRLSFELHLADRLLAIETTRSAEPGIDTLVEKMRRIDAEIARKFVAVCDRAAAR